MPNSAARNLVGKKLKVIGLFIYTAKDVQTVVYLSSLIVALIDRAQLFGYSVVTAIVQDFDPKQILRFLQSGSIEGAIISGGGLDDVEVSNLVESAFSMVFIDKLCCERRLSGRESIVNWNNFKGAYLATQYLLNMGHTDIVYLHGPPNRLASIERLKGDQQALQDREIAIFPENILLGDFSDQ